MSFNWTYPDPLSLYTTHPSLIGGKTRYVVPTLTIYINEIFNTINLIRSVLGLYQLNWELNPSVKDTLLYEHYNFLKLNINTLITHFDYNSVVDILGRDWSELQLDVHGQHFAKWAIIQDFRDVLDVLFPSLEQWIRTEKYIPFYFNPAFPSPGQSVSSYIEGDLGRWYVEYQPETYVNNYITNMEGIHPYYEVYQPIYSESFYQIIPSGIYIGQKNQIGITEGKFGYIPQDAESKIHFQGTGNVACAYKLFGAVPPFMPTTLQFQIHTAIPRFNSYLTEGDFIYTSSGMKFNIYESFKIKLNLLLSAHKGRVIYLENNRYIAGRFQDLKFTIHFYIYNKNNKNQWGKINCIFDTNNSNSELNLTSEFFATNFGITYTKNFSDIDSILDFIPEVKKWANYSIGQLVLGNIGFEIQSTSNLIATAFEDSESFELEPESYIVERDLTDVESWRFEGEIPSYDVKINKLGFVNIV